MVVVNKFIASLVYSMRTWLRYGFLMILLLLIKNK
jgi:hypothetical protein